MLRSYLVQAVVVETSPDSCDVSVTRKFKPQFSHSYLSSIPRKCGMKPSLFVASSPEQFRVAQAIQKRLSAVANIVPWDQGYFRTCKTTAESLFEGLGRYDFAVIVLTCDEMVPAASRPGQEALHFMPCDNVLIQLGLSIGVLGRERTFIVRDACPELKMPSDLLGVKVEEFKLPDSSERHNLQRYLEQACKPIEAEIEKLWIRLDRTSQARVAFIGNMDSLFNREVFSAFCTELAPWPVEVQNEEGCPEIRYENLGGFVAAVDHAQRLGLDYVVSIPPEMRKRDEKEFRSQLSALVRVGLRVVLIEYKPPKLAEFHGHVRVIRSDSTAGAEYLAEQVATMVPPKATIVVVTGPRSSRNASERRKAFQEILRNTEAHTTQIIKGDSWSPSNNAELVFNHLAKKGVPDAIICPNDEIALAVARKLHEHTGKQCDNVRRCRVLGYDGIPHAIIAIADEWNPIHATIRIPVSEYGRRAARLIKRWLREEDMDDGKADDVIPLTRRDVILPDEARRIAGRMPQISEV